MDYARAGYTHQEGYEAHQQEVRDTLAVLTGRYGIPIKKIKYNPASNWCRAMYRINEIRVGMVMVRNWSRDGYCEYRTLQYIIGLKWKRGDAFRQHHKTLIGRKSIQAIMCHEYAHLLSYETYGKVFGRGHGVLFQQIVAEIYDFMFGEDFGAVERFLNKKGKKWLSELHAWGIAQRHKQDKKEIYGYTA